MIYPASHKYIVRAIDTLNMGDIIVYPTDTLYGFGADATNSKAISKINNIKGRTQPLSIILLSIHDIDKYANMDENIKNKLQDILPGPYTVLLPSKNSILSSLVQNGSSKIGIRVIDHNFTNTLVEKLGKPIISTSVNYHGCKPLNDVIQIGKTFPKVDIYKNSNKIKSQGSTIIDFSCVPHKVIRKGEGIYPL